MQGILIIVLLFGVLWFAMIRPQRAKVQAQQRMLGTVAPGDEILTVGGIYGIVQELEPDEDGGDLIVEIADGIHVRIARKALATVIKPEDDDEDDEDGDERRRRRRCRRRGGRARRRRRAARHRRRGCYERRGNCKSRSRRASGAFRAQLAYRRIHDPSRFHRCRFPGHRRARCRGVDDRPVVADPQEADARARPPGWPRDHEGSRSAQGPEADEGRPLPLGHDHARPRRPPRRVGAGDSHAGQQPDHDPAAGRQGSRGGREDHRQDRAARALRPRDEPRGAVDRHQREPAAALERLRPPRRPAGDRQGQVRPVVGLRQEEEARRRPGLVEGEGARQVRRRAACRLQALRHPERHRGDLVRRAGRRVPGCRNAHRRTRTTSSSTTRRRCRR